MNILIKINMDDQVVLKMFKPELLEDKTGWIEINDYESPKQIEGKQAIEYYRGGKIVVEYEDLPEPPLDPAEELEKIKKEFAERTEMLEMAIMDVADFALGGGL